MENRFDPCIREGPKESAIRSILPGHGVNRFLRGDIFLKAISAKGAELKVTPLFD
jgi:hypothetical protein